MGIAGERGLQLVGAEIGRARSELVGDLRQIDLARRLVEIEVADRRRKVDASEVERRW